MLTKLLFLCGVALALIRPALSQTGFWGLPMCQQSCIFSMLDKHVALGCANADVACLCSESNFVYGVRDCILQSCPPEWDNYGNAYLQVCVADLASSNYASPPIYHSLGYEHFTSRVKLAIIEFAGAADADKCDHDGAGAHY